MAQKRMFDKAIIDTEQFMELPMSSKALYFLLGMEADDEGFVSYKKVMRVHGGNEDEIKILIAKGFLIHFQGGLVVITDWHANNYLDKNRLKPSQYVDEKKKLILTESGKYEFNNRLTSIEECSGEESSIGENIQGAETSSAEIKKPKFKAKVLKEKLFTQQGAEIIKEFEVVDPKNKTYYSNKTERASADFLIETYGFDQVLKVVKVLPKTNTGRYFPKIYKPSELKEKWVKLRDNLEIYKASFNHPNL